MKWFLETSILESIKQVPEFSNFTAITINTFDNGPLEMDGNGNPVNLEFSESYVGIPGAGFSCSGANGNTIGQFVDGNNWRVSSDGNYNLGVSYGDFQIMIMSNELSFRLFESYVSVPLSPNQIIFTAAGAPPPPPPPPAQPQEVENVVNVNGRILALSQVDPTQQPGISYNGNPVPAGSIIEHAGQKYIAGLSHNFFNFSLIPATAVPAWGYGEYAGAAWETLNALI